MTAFRFAAWAALTLGWLPVPEGRSAAQDGPYKVEAVQSPAPEELAPPIKAALGAEAYRVLDSGGKPFAEIWLRKSIPAAKPPGPAEGAILFPSLPEGTLLGAIRFAQEGHDYRDQAIVPGVYTLRYGLQPVNGDHLGVSPNRDYVLLIAADKDTDIEPIAVKRRDTLSAEAAESNHPAVFYLKEPPAGAQPGGIVHDAEKDLWGLLLPLSLAVPGSSQPAPLLIQMIVVGAAPV